MSSLVDRDDVVDGGGQRVGPPEGLVHGASTNRTDPLGSKNPAFVFVELCTVLAVLVRSESHGSISNKKTRTDRGKGNAHRVEPAGASGKYDDS